jgi:cytochrome c-type biogenesis protein
LRRRIRAVQLTGGVLLLALGALLVTGLWGEIVAVLRGPIAGFSTPI